MWLRLCLFLCMILAIGGVFVIIPINSSGDKLLEEEDTEEIGRVDLAILTIANVDENDPKFLAHILFAFLFSFVVYAAVWWQWTTYTKLRQDYLNRNDCRSFTVIAQQVPPRLRSERVLKEWFEDHFYPCKVLDVQLVWNSSKLDKYCQQRLSFINGVERAELEMDEIEQRRQRKRQKKARRAGQQQDGSHHKPWWRRFLACLGKGLSFLCCGCHACGGSCWTACCCCWCCHCNERNDRTTVRTGPNCCCGFWQCCCCGEEVDAETHYRKRLDRVEQKIQLIQENPSKFMQKTHTAFVTFDSPFPCRSSTHAFVNPLIMRVHPAPEYTDVDWSQLAVGKLSFEIRRVLIVIVLIAIIILWIFPFLFAVSLANLRELGEVDGMGWLADFINQLPVNLVVFIEGILPTLILLLFMNFMKLIFKLIITNRGFYARSFVEFTTMSTYASFLVLNVLLVSTIGGAIFDVLEDLVDNPTSFISLLADSLPKQSLFFINYLLVVGLGRLPLKLFRPGQLFKRLFLCLSVQPKTQREKFNVHKPPMFDFAGESGQEILVFNIVLVFSLMAPLVSLFGVVYFALAYLVNRYNLIYANQPEWESGGAQWQYLYHHIMAGLLLFQLTMVGVFGLSETYGGGGAMLVLPFMTTFWWIVVWHHFAGVASQGALEGCYALEAPQVKNVYRQPSMLYIDSNSDGEEESDYDSMEENEMQRKMYYLRQKKRVPQQKPAAGQRKIDVMARPNSGTGCLQQDDDMDDEGFSSSPCPASSPILNSSANAAMENAGDSPSGSQRHPRNRRRRPTLKLSAASPASSSAEQARDIYELKALTVRASAGMRPRAIPKKSLFGSVIPSTPADGGESATKSQESEVSSLSDSSSEEAETKDEKLCENDEDELDEETEGESVF
ncbi:hypothetical protein QOT17_025465 [Balamuthia mandrillaris]